MVTGPEMIESTQVMQPASDSPPPLGHRFYVGFRELNVFVPPVLPALLSRHGTTPESIFTAVLAFGKLSRLDSNCTALSLAKDLRSKKNSVNKLGMNMTLMIRTESWQCLRSAFNFCLGSHGALGE